MSAFNTPFLLGFDELEEMLGRMTKSAEGFPPYNIEQLNDGKLRITLAVAGYVDSDLDMTLEDNQLIIRGHQDQDTEHRINDHRTHTVQGLRESGGQLLQPDHHISCRKSREQCSQESCVHLAARRVKEGASRFCHKPCHESDRQSRTVRDAHGNVSCQHREHHIERELPDRLKIRCHRGIFSEIRRVDTVIIQQERQGDQDTASDHEWEHMRHPVHQIFIDLSPNAFIFHGGLCRGGSARVMIDRDISAHCFVYELLRLVDPVRHLHADDRLAVKS